MKNRSFIVFSILPISFGFLAAPLRAEFAYVVNESDNTVSAYHVNNETGALTPVLGSPFTTGPMPFGVAVDPTARFVYVTNDGDNTVSAYRVDKKTGALTQVPGSPFAAGASPSLVTVDRGAEFAYVANGNDNTVSVYRIDRKTGALTPVPGSPTWSITAATTSQPTASITGLGP